MFTLVCFVVLWGCATVPRETNTIASVDGEIITVEDLIYSLNVSHRLEDLSSAGHLDISGFVQGLVDELLIVQEAQRMGIEDYPEMRKKLDAYVLRESVVRLHNDEILEKAPVSEAEIRERFRRDYERFTLGIISVGSQEDAAGILVRLKDGEDFGELARDHSVDYSLDGGEKTLKWNEMIPVLKKVVVDITAGEFSNVIKIEDKFFYIVKLIERQEADEETFEHNEKNIKNQLSKSKTKERSDEYLAELRAKADIEIDQELLSSLESDKKEGLQNHLKDKRVLVIVKDTVLTAGDFAARLVSSKINSGERLLNNWIDIQLVNYEALSRHYELEPYLKDKLRRYKRQLLIKLFVNKIIVPGIGISLKETEDYYIQHKEDFVKPYMYKIQKITLETIEDAQDVLKSLDGGASFSWLAKRKSTDMFALKGGAVGWKMKDQLPVSAAEIIDTLKPGEISPIIEVDDYFSVIKVQEKSKPDFEEFDAVKQMIQQRIFKEKYNDIYNEYVDRLKKIAQIYIDEEAVELYKSKFEK